MRTGAMAEMVWRVCEALSRKPVVAGLLLVLVCAMVTLPGLGAHGFVNSEAHRAVPAFEMLERGEFIVPTMFDQVYLRKPPGMPWLIALSSRVFGETEFAARFVSACAWTCSVLLIWIFACRWFGKPFGLCAALACVLWPWFWTSARSAEIEALHNMFSVLFVLSCIDLVVWQKRMPAHDSQKAIVRALSSCAAIAIGLSGMFAVKGGAGLAAIGGVLIGATYIRMKHCSRLDARVPVQTVAIVVFCAIVGVGAFTSIWLRQYLAASSQDAVTQSSAHFLWNMEKLHRILIIVFDAFVAGAPWMFAALWPWGPFARDEAKCAVVTGVDMAAHDRLVVAQTVSLACIAGLVISMIAGVSNVRYTMPVGMPACVLVAYCMRGWRMHFGRTRRVFWRICTLGSPLLVYLLLLIAIAIYYTKFEERRARLSGREIGFEIGAAVQTDMDRSQVSDTVVLADHLVEARPEILLAIENTANTHVRWISGLSESASLEQVGGVVYLALREDDDSDERSAMQRSGALENADLVGEWSFREYRIIVYRVNTTRTN